MLNVAAWLTEWKNQKTVTCDLIFVVGGCANYKFTKECQFNMVIMYQPGKVYKWVEKFKGGQTDTIDDPCSGWPLTVTCWG
jgi:hypothetical protein